MDIVQLSMFDGKVCPKCQTWKNYVDFGKNRAKTDGHQNYCYSCRSTASTPHRFRATHTNQLSDGKVCPGCLKWKQISAFNKRQTNGKYRHAYCVDCNREKKSILRKTNPEKVNATRRLYYQRNSTRINEMRLYRTYQTEGSHSLDEWTALCKWFGDKCLACGTSKQITIDHVVPLVFGGTNYITNLQPLCRSCNCTKRMKTIDYRDPERLTEFLEHIRCLEPIGDFPKLSADTH